ncbi:3-phosphoshikimate 1-carboxyvinyltransferase [Corticicoccus populi]|uniref:3-phosphoshikimate 1-carboxyvinyltransferase n=1 Tax=Corticicoccus populi TaxID=1812821 RepID=A0ABW5WS62_9STAP
MKELLNSKFTGSVSVPGDKSITHRAMMLGALTKGETKITAPLISDDTLRTLACMEALGATSRKTENDYIISSPGRDQLKSPEAQLYTGNSGTTTRLLTGLITGLGLNASMNGDSSIEKRPMDRVAAPLREMGADITLKDDKYPPIQIQSSPLHTIEYIMPVASAQVKSAILFAGLFLDGKTIIHEESPSRNHSELMLSQFGADIKTEGNSVILNGGRELVNSDIVVPGDISSAAFLMVLAAITPDSDITLNNVSLNDSRSGIIDVFEDMGVDFEITRHNNSGELYGDIRVKYTENLKPFNISGDLIPRLIDEIPVLTLLALSADGESRVDDAEELRFKETDRIRAVVDELNKIGVSFDEREDGYTVKPAEIPDISKISFKGYHDHRIIMMLIIMAISSNQEIHIDDPSAISISYPNFLDDLKSIRGDK